MYYIKSLDYFRLLLQPLKIGRQLQNVHTGVEFSLGVASHLRSDAVYHARGLINSFLLALGQAKLVYGPDVKGDLPVPIAVNFVSTDGQKFHFSAFQLNTLDLDNEEGIKNIYWCDSNIESIYQTCDYVKAVPTLAGYNHDVFKKFAALYLDNSK